MLKSRRGKPREYPRRPVGVLQCSRCRAPNVIHSLWPCGGELLCYGCMTDWLGIRDIDLPRPGEPEIETED